jgi:hypothetical protein
MQSPDNIINHITVSCSHEPGLTCCREGGKTEISKEPQSLDVWLLQKIIKLITILKLRTVQRIVSL